MSVLSTLTKLVVGAAVVNGVVYDCDIKWADSLKPENMLETAMDSMAAMKAAGWTVRTYNKADWSADETPAGPTDFSGFQQWTSDRTPGYKAGYAGISETWLTLTHEFKRPYKNVKFVVENGSERPNIARDTVSIGYSSGEKMTGSGTQMQGGRGAFSIGTLMLSDVRIGDVITITERRSMIHFLELSYDCSDTWTPPAPSLPPQPQGPEVTITMVQGCDLGAEPAPQTFPIPVIWAQGECQADPMNQDDPTTDDVVEQASLMLQCVKDGSMWVRIWENPTCDGQPRDNLFLRHEEPVRPNEFEGEGPEQCHMFQLPEEIRKACELPEPTSTPAPAPVGPPTICKSTGDPHFWAFHYKHDNGQIVNLSNQERYFDFQHFGEFQLWGTDGLDVQVRHGSRLDMTTTTVATNNAIVLQGDKTCGIKYEIYGRNGYWMRATIPGQANPVEFFGKSAVLQGISTFAGFQNCASSEIDVLASENRVQWTFEGIVIKAQLSVYGIDIFVEVEGEFYLPTDTGICPKGEGWQTELNCDSLFTMYPNDDCAGMPRPTNKPIDTTQCNPQLRQQAEQRCNACPKVVRPEECVREVCGAGNIAAAAQLLRLCDIDVTPIKPRGPKKCQCTGDPHCTWFDGVRQDFQARGEFVFYKNKGVEVMVRQGYRPDIKHHDTISTNHAVSIQGPWTCGVKYEFYYDTTMGVANPHTAAVPFLMVTKGGKSTRHDGLTAILAELANDEKHSCGTIVNRGNVIEFVLEDDSVRVRVQQEWWGINVWVDVAAKANSPNDEGMCTRKSFEPVDCDDSPFSLFKKGGCKANPPVLTPPAKPTLPPCSKQLMDDARKVCGACPKVVTMDECLFEACTIGDISAAHEMVKACKGTPVAPVPVPTKAPVPDVYCSTYNDPHMRYFDNTSGDNMNRGHFLFYKTTELEIQARHGPYLTLAETHPSYNTVSTNNAIVFTGSFVCGAIVEVDAFKPTVAGSKLGEGKMRITKDGKTKTFDSILEMTENAKKINDLVCGGFSVDGTYAGGKYGPIFILQKDGYNFRWQNRPHGINAWITVEGVKYLSSDSGMCTKRGDYERALNCDEILFTKFPKDHSCAEEKKNDKKIPVPKKPDCDAKLLKEATVICNQCPDVVAPQECVIETCLLGAIEFAEEQVVACGIKPPTNTCGRIGSIRSKGKKINVTKQKTACECRDACEAAGGLEWQFKAKRGKCGCYTGSGKMTYKAGDVSNTKKRLVGKLNGSGAKLTDEA